MPNSETTIRVLALAVIDARLALADAIRKACPGPHSYVDHHDGHTWWCYFCGYTEAGSRVTRPNPAGAWKCPDHPGPLDDARDHVCRLRPVDTRPNPSDGGVSRG